MFKQFTISTKERYELVDITGEVEELVASSGVQDGTVAIFTPHSTAAIILTENEPGLKQDWLEFLKTLVSGYDFKHDRIDDNADSHLLSGLLGQSRTLIIDNGSLVRGAWQNIFLVELDGSRERKVAININ